MFLLAAGYGYFQIRVREVASELFGPWMLSPSEKRDLGKALDQEKNHVSVSIHCLIASSQSQSLTNDLIIAFRNHGWTDTAGTCINNLRPDIYGVGIALPSSAFENFGIVPPEAEVARYILAVSGLAPVVAPDLELNSGFYVVVGSRPIR
jgi:hypothetical protein